jgi:hypothetical protein
MKTVANMRDRQEYPTGRHYQMAMTQSSSAISRSLDRPVSRPENAAASSDWRKPCTRVLAAFVAAGVN